MMKMREEVKDRFVCKECNYSIDGACVHWWSAEARRLEVMVGDCSKALEGSHDEQIRLGNIISKQSEELAELQTRYDIVSGRGFHG